MLGADNYSSDNLSDAPLGRLIGRETFQKQVEAMTGRRFVGEARGRPKKATAIAIEKVL
jgi:hypothetical protein